MTKQVVMMYDRTYKECQDWKAINGDKLQQMVAATSDGETWSWERRCFLMNRDFWYPLVHDGCYWATCDTSGHVPRGVHIAVDFLVSADGERWSWVSEIVHGSDGPE